MPATDRQRENIIATTLALIAEQGIASLSASDVASGAGISRQTLYNHFSDVGAVIEAALEAHGAAMAPHLEGLIANEAGLSAKIAAVLDFMVAVNDPAHLAVSLEAGVSADARNRLGLHDLALRAVLEAMLTAETGRSSPDLADLLWALIEAGAKAIARNPDQASDLRRRCLAGLHQTLA